MSGIQMIGVAAAALLTGAVLENVVPLVVVKDKVTMPSGMMPLPRIVQVSDLHRRQFGPHNSRLIRKIGSLRPDIIAMTGDQISRTVTDLSELERLLWTLRGLATIVMVPGNHELDLPSSLYDRYRQVTERCGVHYLENRTEFIDGIPFAGLTLKQENYRIAGSYHDLEDCTAEDITDALGCCLPGTVLLAHNPLFLETYAKWGAALVLSGHMHGGIVRLPKIGGILSPERKFFPKYDKGCYTLEQTTMIVSGGLGKLRFGNPPELRVITSVSQPQLGMSPNGEYPR